MYPETTGSMIQAMNLLSENIVVTVPLNDGTGRNHMFVIPMTQLERVEAFLTEVRAKSFEQLVKDSAEPKEPEVWFAIKSLSGSVSNLKVDEPVDIEELKVIMKTAKAIRIVHNNTEYIIACDFVNTSGNVVTLHCSEIENHSNTKPITLGFAFK